MTGYEAILLAALAPFARNAHIFDEYAELTYGDGPVFQRVSLDDDGNEVCWSFTIEDIRAAALAVQECS